MMLLGCVASTPEVGTSGLAPSVQSQPSPRRLDRIFGLETPLLFAHRGGALEVPESTLLAFDYAVKEAHADVLELDLQLTHDGVIVVWHGPELDNVHIEGVTDTLSDRPCDRRKIGDFSWKDLEYAWVSDPPDSANKKVTILPIVPRCKNRKLLRFTDFLDWLSQYPEIPLNIELKEPFKPKDIPQFIRELQKAGTNRRMVIASNRNEHLLEVFRVFSPRPYPTNLPFLQLLGAHFRYCTGQDFKSDPSGFAFQVARSEWMANRDFIDWVHQMGGSVHVFLTQLPLLGLSSLDAQPDNDDYRKKVREILDRGVDGIMTDRPLRVRHIIDKWKEKPHEGGAD